MFIIDPAKVEEIHAKLDELALVYDGRLLGAVMMNRVAGVYSTLHSLGLETPESLNKLFTYGLAIAMAPPESKPTVMYQSEDSAVTKQ